MLGKETSYFQTRGEIGCYFMKIALWIVQILLALVFVASGSMKLFAFDQFVASAPALADQRGLVTFIGICELAGSAWGSLPPRLPDLQRTRFLPSIEPPGGRSGRSHTPTLSY